MGNKQIGVIAGSIATRDRIVQQLERVLEGHAQVTGYSVTEGLSCCISSDLLVYSSAALVAEAANWVDSSCPSIIARRAIDTQNLGQIYDIKRGTQVLLVNDDFSSATESIELLVRMGIDHVGYHPWYPELSDAEKAAQVSLCHMAVTLGEADLVPREMISVMDIGPRVIDISTIVEILHHLDLLDERSHYLTASYLATAVNLTKTIHKQMAEQERLNERLSQVLHQVNEGILSYDKEGIIRVFSQRCELIFGIRSDRAIGKYMTQVIKQPQLLAFLKQAEDLGEPIINLGQEAFAVTKFLSPGEGWTVCTLKNLNDLATLAAKRQRQLLSLGHVAKYTFEDIRHSAEVMTETINTAKQLAKTRLSVLIQGESGTGKELFASAMHRHSERANGPYLGVNFSALPEDLVESELFGYEEGAFTGAKKGGKPGLFELASGGTLFLDEIGDISLKIQARLLRVLQEKEVMRLGGTEVMPVDVRIIAATNKPLLSMCQTGKFREDLYYRLKRLSLTTPPLRERREDIPELFMWFLSKNGWQGSWAHQLSPELKQALTDHPWQGNVRELESIAEYVSVVAAEDNYLGIKHLPGDFIRGTVVNGGEMGTAVSPTWTTHPPDVTQPPETFTSPSNALSGGGDRGVAKIEDLLAQGQYVQLMRLILAANDAGQNIGRERLAKALSEQGFQLSVDQVRTRLKHLEELDLVRAYKGRKGVSLTAKGRELVKLA